MKKMGIGLIILAVVALFLFFILLFGQNEFPSTIEEESQMLIEDLERKIRLEFDDKGILVLLENNDSARTFYVRLPLEFEFKDYASTEKVTDLLEPYLSQKVILAMIQIWGILPTMHHGKASYFIIRISNTLADLLS